MSCYVAHTINMYSWSFCRGDKTYEEKNVRKGWLSMNAPIATHPLQNQKTPSIANNIADMGFLKM